MAVWAGGKAGIAKLCAGNHQGANGFCGLSPTWRQKPTNCWFLWVCQGLQVSRRNEDTSAAG